jgi:hypothetical protein
LRGVSVASETTGSDGFVSAFARALRPVIESEGLPTMDEAFACPECGTNVEVRGLAPGRQVRCGFCHRLIEVPYLTRVESPGFRRLRFGRRRWVMWAWAGVGAVGALVIVVAALRFLYHHQQHAEIMSIHGLIASSRLHEGAGELGQALNDLDTAISLCSQSSTVKSDELTALKEKRPALARRDAQAILDKLEQGVVQPFPLGDWLNLQARISADPDLEPLRQPFLDQFTRKLRTGLQADLAEASRLFESGKPVAAFETCESATSLLSHVPPDLRASLHGQFEDLVRRIIARSGIVIDPIRGQLLAGSTAAYNATMVPELVKNLRAKGYVPQRDTSSWRDRWSAAPFRLVVELNERLEGNYMSTQNRLTRIDAHLELLFQGREVWQATPTVRTAVPLPNLPAYQSARMALKRDRSPEIEKLLYNDARSQIGDKFAFGVRNMPECNQVRAAASP